MGWGYGTLASEVYDLDKPIGSTFGDVEYYRDALDGMRGPVLEPAVGTGRILIPLVEAGVEVEGYDSSPEMLAICRAHCAERGLDPVLRDGDMTGFVEAQRYSAAIVPTGSITLLTGRGALVDALACFRECLAPGGRLIVDVPAPQLLLESEAMRSWSSGEFVWTLQTTHVEYDAAENQTVRWLRYEKWRGGALVATELQLFRLQHWSTTEFAALLEQCGFEEPRVVGDYQAHRAPDADTGGWTFHAARA
jgi:SAM-dependent methyltransferase